MRQAPRSLTFLPAPCDAAAAAIILVLAHHTFKRVTR